MIPTVIIPVMTLGDCVFLPQQLLPLRIFEPRYRKMLKEALAGNKMFAVSQLDEDSLDTDNPEPPCPFTCVGRIVGHIENDDGTDHVVLEGLRRAKVIRVKRKTPYPLLEIAPVVDTDIADQITCTRDIARVLNYSEKIVSDLGPDADPLIQRLRALANLPGALADAAAGHLVAESHLRRQVLECLSPEQRIRAVADELARLDAQRSLGEQGGEPGLN